MLYVANVEPESIGDPCGAQSDLFFLLVLEVRGPFLHLINFTDFEAVRVKVAFYSRI